MAERAAPSSKPVDQKLQLKPGARALIVGAPPGFVDLLSSDVHIDQQPGGGAYDFIQLFATRRADLLKDAAALRTELKPNGLFWVAYPKGKALPTDLNRDIIRVALEEVGLETVSQVAIDDVWSALRAKVV